METEKYRALMCAIETGSLTAAAERLQYTPSGISRMVSALEEETGFPLLLREHGGVRPTAECTRMLGAFRALLYAADSCATYSMVEAGLGLSMNNALNGRSWSGNVRILPLDPPQTVEIGAASLPEPAPAAGTFLDFLKLHLSEFKQG